MDKVIGRNETQGKSNRQITFQPVNILLQFLDRLLSELGAGLSLEWGENLIRLLKASENDKVSLAGKD
jgi:hypothetical protein